MRKRPQDDVDVQDLLWQIEYSRRATKAAGKVTLWALLGLVSIILLIVPFLAGFPWHQYWDACGKYLLITSSIPFLLSIYLVGQLTIRWQLTLDFRKELRELLEDRYQLVGAQQAIELGAKE